MIRVIHSIVILVSIFLICVCVCLSCLVLSNTPTGTAAAGGRVERYTLDKRMPRASLGLDGILVALKVIVELVLLVIMMTVTAAMMLLRFLVLLVLLDRHRYGQRHFLYDRLGVHMRVMLHRHVDAYPANVNVNGNGNVNASVNGMMLNVNDIGYIGTGIAYMGEGEGVRWTCR